MSVQCDVRVELFSEGGGLLKATSATGAKVKVKIWDDNGKPYFFIAAKQTVEKFSLGHEVQIHANRMERGVLSIVLPHSHVQIFLSNARPDKLNRLLQSLVALEALIAPCRSSTTTPSNPPNRMTATNSSLCSSRLTTSTHSLGSSRITASPSSSVYSSHKSMSIASPSSSIYSSHKTASTASVCSSHVTASTASLSSSRRPMSEKRKGPMLPDRSIGEEGGIQENDLPHIRRPLNSFFPVKSSQEDSASLNLKAKPPKASRHVSSLIPKMKSLKNTERIPDSETPTVLDAERKQLLEETSYEDVMYSVEQRDAMSLAKEGKSFLLTGSSGTGKSCLLDKIIKSLPSTTTFVTASTGLAACQLQGTTIFHFAGIGVLDAPLEELVERAKRRSASERWRKCKVLIIDDISMLDANTFDKLEHVARKIRGNDLPFGGIQLILCGDFHQLPPPNRGVQSQNFCFDAICWRRCVPFAVVLRSVFRQDDPNFVRILNAVREGRCTGVHLQELYEGCNKGENLNNEDIKFAKLSIHKDVVKEENERNLNSLPGISQTFVAKDESFGGGGSALHLLKSSCPARDILELKEGAQVVLLKNISVEEGLHIGALGKVVRFTDKLNLPVVRFLSGKEVVVGKERWSIKVGGRVMATRLQLPLDLAWALSVYKSQGMTLDRVEVSLKRVLDCGQAYVILSRARSMEGLRIVGNISPQAIRANPAVLQFYRKLQVLPSLQENADRDF